MLKKWEKSLAPKTIIVPRYRTCKMWINIADIICGCYGLRATSISAFCMFDIRVRESICSGLPNYRRLPQTTADQCPCSPQTKENSRKSENVKLTTFTQIRNTANYRRLIFHYCRPILTCGKATCETDGKLPQTTFYLPQTNYT